MSDDFALRVTDVSKVYRMWRTPGARLTTPLLQRIANALPEPIGDKLARRAAAGYRDFHALKGVSLEVSRGESMGIIGRNGSGKSTLLQIIAGTLQPTSGSVEVRGRVAALLELGSGFNPEFTGRENVYLNAAVLGLTRAQTDERFDRIAAFADIGDFLDQPVKTYSSGMQLRLAFAVQTAVEPDLLIVDEALSVGDGPFQAKCFGRIRRMIENGVSILFVSHDLGAVRAFCHRALWLHGGEARSQGAMKEVADAYQRECWRASGMEIGESSGQTTVPAARRNSTGWGDNSEFAKHAAKGRQGAGPVKIQNFFLQDSAGKRTTIVRFDLPVYACWELASETGYSGNFQLGCTVKTPEGVELVSATDRTHSLHLDVPPRGLVRLRLRFALPLRAGKYYVTTGLFAFPPEARFAQGTYDFTRSTVMDRVEYAAFVAVEPQVNLGIYGPVHAEGQLSAVRDDEAP